MNIKDAINQIVYTSLKKYGITLDMITTEKLIIADLHADSLDIIEMMLAFEEKFDTLINEEDISKIFTVGDIYQYITAHRKQVMIVDGAL